MSCKKVNLPSIVHLIVKKLPLYTRLDHITCHQLQPLVEVLAKLRVGPVEVADEGLQRLQFPEEILRSRTAVAEIRNVRLKTPPPN